MGLTRRASGPFVQFAIAVAQRLIPFTPSPIYPGSSQAWIVPSRKAYKAPQRMQPLFPNVRRMLVSLRNAGEPPTLYDECDEVADTTPRVVRSTASSLTSEDSMLLSPQDYCADSARWIHLPEDESATGYILDSFGELSLAEPVAQEELVTSLDGGSPSLHKESAAKEFASFTWVRALGEGGYAATVAVRETRQGAKQSSCSKAAGRLLCLKIFVKPVVLKRDLLYGVQRELLAYQTLALAKRIEGSAFVMELDGVLEDDNRIYFAMELMKYDLMAVLTEGMPGRRLNKKRWIAQIAAGLDALHGIGIIHRDIKPENIMIDSRDNIRIADLGASYVSPQRERLLATVAYTDEMLGTWPYIAPEVMDTRGKPKSKRKGYSIAVDYWALGCIIFELEAPGAPLLFETEEDLALYRRWDQGMRGKSYIAGMGLPVEVETLVLGLVHLDPHQRFDIKNLCKHSYFRRPDGTTEFEDIEARALRRPSSRLDEDEDEIARLDTPLVFSPVMREPTGPVDPSSFDNLCWINPHGFWES
ncbi:hypothetical protein AX15_000953 [Amanita polypyramis BW_CC]|nr:hypothetical protein AX15_000953 [Amanita polypyramis BW_CC]